MVTTAKLTNAGHGFSRFSWMDKFFSTVICKTERLMIKFRLTLSASGYLILKFLFSTVDET
jgi:hypothetical protein